MHDITPCTLAGRVPFFPLLTRQVAGLGGLLHLTPRTILPEPDVASAES